MLRIHPQRSSLAAIVLSAALATGALSTGAFSNGAFSTAAFAGAPDSQPTSQMSMASCHMVDTTPDPAFAPGLAVGDHKAADALGADGDDAMNAGRIEQAAQDWAAALAKYQDAHDAADYCETARRLGGAYQAIGNYRLAYPILVKALALADCRHDDKASMGLCSALGSVLTFSRPPGDDPPIAQPFLDRSIALAKQLNDADGEAAALNDLGNYQSSLNQTDDAMKSFADAAMKADAASYLPLAAKARTNAALTASRSANPMDAQPLLASAAESVDKLPDSAEKGSLLVSLGRCAQLTAEAAPADAGDAQLLSDANDTYRRAIDLAAASNDARTSSFAWGYLGNLYEVHGGDSRLDDALTATHRARFFAQSLQRRETMYRWEWQCGRILARQGNPDEAIKSYQRALDSLQAVRDDVALGYGGSAFRKNVGPMFYELADLLLQRSGNLQAADPIAAQQSLEDARSAVETLKATELKNYFQDECVRVASSKQEDVDAALRTAVHTAVLYVIPLEDRTELLVSLPPTNGLGRPVLWRADPVKVGRAKLYAAAQTMAYDEQDASTGEFAKSGAVLYDWLVRPVLSQLTSHGITTLVFVPDGDLRLISPAALYDSKTKTFLVQSYAIAVTPGLTLASPEAAKPRANIRVLAAGLSEEQTVKLPGEQAEVFDALPGVAHELQGMQAVYGAQGTTLSNAAFQQKNVETALDEDQYSIVHLATHAQFNQDARKTFVLAHDGPMDLNRLEQLIEPSQFRGQPVELLSLSACETAAGDDGGRAALGLAGVAIRAGARSALATLWLADDQATSELIPVFYRELGSGNRPSKAEALQRAQVQILTQTQFSHPRFWAPFLIIGNWR